MPVTKGVPRPSGLTLTTDTGVCLRGAGDGGVDHSGTADGGAGDGMEAGGELMGHAQGRGVAGAGGTADFNEAGGGLLGDAEGQARGAAHEHLGGVAVDQHGGRTKGEGAEMSADEFNFAERQSGGGNDVVDAGIGENVSGGLVRGGAWSFPA